MLLAVSELKGYSIEASDGGLGIVGDCLFDDRDWRIRWLVVDTGTWLSGRKVLIHPSAIRSAIHEWKALPVELTRAKVESSPEIEQHQPVSRQTELHLYDYYNCDPNWNSGSLVAGGATSVSSVIPRPGDAGVDGGPRLRSAAAIRGCHILATDGELGHVEDVLLDDAIWDVRYLAIDTRNWWPGRQVLVSPHAVKQVDWLERWIRLDVSRHQVKDSPPWDQAGMVDREYEERLHTYYRWPLYVASGREPGST